ncbi:hypothetical protein SALBM311S_00965 [Streptomyces alboniger]
MRRRGRAPPAIDGARGGAAGGLGVAGLGDRLRASAWSPSRRTAMTSAPSARSQGGSIGPRAPRISPSCGVPSVSNSSPRTMTSAGAGDGGEGVVSGGRRRGPGPPGHQGADREELVAAAALLAAWPDVLAVRRLGPARAGPCSLRRTRWCPDAGAGGDRTASPSVSGSGWACPARTPVVPDVPGAWAGDRPAVHRGGVEGGQVGEAAGGAARVRPRAPSRRTETGARRAALFGDCPGPRARGWPGPRVPCSCSRVSGTVRVAMAVLCAGRGYLTTGTVSVVLVHEASTSSTSRSSASSALVARAVIRRPGAASGLASAVSSSAQRRARPAALRDASATASGPPPAARPHSRRGRRAQRAAGRATPAGGVAGEVEQHARVDVEVDAEFVLDCGNPFIQHVPMLPDAPALAVAMSSQVSQSKDADRGRGRG